MTFFTLPPGDFIVVPQTAQPHCDGKFLLRIFTDEQVGNSRWYFGKTRLFLTLNYGMKGDLSIR